MLGRALDDWRRRIAPRSECDEEHRVATTKGWTVPVRRHRARGPRADAPPLVLCHGLGANHLNFDWDPPHGLAQFLAARGHDCWVLGLRGSRGSQLDGHPRDRWEIDFDDYLHGDVPSVLAFVRSQTGAERVSWIGHSLGGLMGLASEHPFVSVVALAAGISYGRRPAAAKLLRGVARASRWLTGEPRVPQARLAQLESPLMGRVPLPSFLSPPGIAPDLIRRLHAHVAEDVPAPVLEQLALWLERGQVTSRDGRAAYAESLSRSPASVLLMGGGADAWSAPESLRSTLSLLPRGRHEHVVLDRANGSSADYAHVDVVFGPRAPEEVFPRIDAFLTRARR